MISLSLERDALCFAFFRPLASGGKQTSVRMRNEPPVSSSSSLSLSLSCRATASDSWTPATSSSPTTSPSSSSAPPARRLSLLSLSLSEPRFCTFPKKTWKSLSRSVREAQLVRASSLVFRPSAWTSHQARPPRQAHARRVHQPQTHHARRYDRRHADHEPARRRARLEPPNSRSMAGQRSRPEHTSFYGEGCTRACIINSAPRATNPTDCHDCARAPRARGAPLNAAFSNSILSLQLGVASYMVFWAGAPG